MTNLSIRLRISTYGTCSRSVCNSSSMFSLFKCMRYTGKGHLCVTTLSAVNSSDTCSPRSKMTFKSSTGTLSHRSAICLIPHRSAWPSIQAVRSIHDKAYTRWPPHINLLYPFLPDSVSGAAFAEAAQLASQRLSNMNAFEVRVLSRFSLPCIIDSSRICL